MMIMTDKIDTKAIRAQYSDGEYLDAYPEEACATTLALCGEVDELRADNERLRTALTKINVGDGWAAQIARAALGRDGNMYSAVNTAC